MSEGIEEVGERAFNSSTVLEKLDLPSTLKQIGPDIIEYCPKLSELNIEYGITDIGFRAFDTYGRIDKSSLTKIIIPDSVKNIKYCAFGYLPLKNIKIPASVENIDVNAFSGCSYLENIEVDENNKNYKSINGMLYNKEGTKLIHAAGGKTINVPEKTKTIGESAFGYNNIVTEINIPDSVNTIESNAFEMCSSLNKISLPNSITKIENYTFEGCETLKNITIPNSITCIGQGAFHSCKALTGITIPNSVTKIESHAFSNCESLTSITIPSSVKIMGDSVFAGDTITVNVFFKENEKPEGWDEDWKEGYSYPPSKITVNYAK